MTKTPAPQVIARMEYAPGRSSEFLLEAASPRVATLEIVANVTGREKGWHSDPAWRTRFRILHTTKGDYRLFPDFSVVSVSVKAPK